MAYLNLLYRERADLAESSAEYQRDVQVADSFVQRALAAKKTRGPQKTQRLRLVAAPPATDAATRYRYRPTLLNGVPVEVMTQVDVNFVLP